jgi:acetoin utilization protein AcuB
MRVRESDSCHHVAEQMSRNRVRHLPVIANDGMLQGVVTDRDLRHHLFRPARFEAIGMIPVESLLKASAVKEIMSSPARSIAPDVDIAEAARLMSEHKIGSLPVTENGRVVGIVTEVDLLRRMIDANACCRDVETIVVSYP